MFLLCLLSFYPPVSSNHVDLNLCKLFVIEGKDDFSEVSGVCEGNDGSVFVLDSKNCRIFKYSNEGALITSFGECGQGPGDLFNPGRITTAPDNSVAVSNGNGHVSIFSSEGSFKKTYKFPGKISVGFISPNVFYDWNWTEDGKKQQVLLDANNAIIGRFFSVKINDTIVTIPDTTGRRVGFSYGDNSYLPQLLFSTYSGRSVLACSREYKLLIFDSMGKKEQEITRNVQPSFFTRAELDYLEKQIRDHCKAKGWPNKVSKSLISIVPKEKNFFSSVFITDKYVFTCRISENIAKQSAARVLDMFTLDNTFLGAVVIPGTPIYISDERIYITQDDGEDISIAVLSYRQPNKGGKS